MTPKEQAEQLFQLYLPYVQSSNYIEEIKDKCKKCALIAVDEILNSILGNYEFDFLRKYWQEVKQEIEKL